MRLFPLSYPTLLATTLLSVTACSYLIPEDPSAPRYNIVEGDVHAPIMNSKVGEHAGDAYHPPALEKNTISKASGFGGDRLDPSQAIPVTPATSSPSERHVPVEQAPVSSVPAANQAPAVVEPVAVAALPPAAPKSLVDIPPAMITIPPAADERGRKVPIENHQASLQLAQNYPDLTAVPQRPDVSPVPRMQEMRKGLEGEQKTTEQEGKTLRDDAAKEPSLQGEPLPVMPPVSLQVPPASFSAPQHPEAGKPPVVTATVPSPEPVAVSGLPAPQPLEVAALPATDALAESKTAAPAEKLPPLIDLEPIRLQPPVAEIAPVKQASQLPLPSEPVPAPLAPMPTASADGFDPLAEAAEAGRPAQFAYGSGSGYLPVSRYAQRRVMR